MALEIFFLEPSSPGTSCRFDVLTKALIYSSRHLNTKLRITVVGCVLLQSATVMEFRVKLAKVMEKSWVFEIRKIKKSWNLTNRSNILSTGAATRRLSFCIKRVCFHISVVEKSWNFVMAATLIYRHVACLVGCVLLQSATPRREASVFTVRRPHPRT